MALPRWFQYEIYRVFHSDYFFKKRWILAFFHHGKCGKAAFCSLDTHYRKGVRRVIVFNHFGKFGHPFQWWKWHFHWPEKHAHQRHFSLWKENSVCFIEGPLSCHIDYMELLQMHIIITVCIATSQDAANRGSHWTLHPTWWAECQPKGPCHCSMHWLAKSFT